MSYSLSSSTTIGKSDLGLSNVENLKVKLDAIVAPVTTDDSGSGYAIGSRWIDVTNDKEYTCVDATTSAAVWIEITGGGGGETNTASNIGVGGVGVFKQKTGVDLEFKKINAGSNKILITDDTGNNEVDVDLVEGNITIGNLSGAPTGTVVGTTDAQTLTNKTIAAGSNTITGLASSDVGLGNVQNLKVNLAASAAPTSTDDSGSGYAVGSRWVDVTADKEYVCVDATTSAAVWTETTGSGAGTAQVFDAYDTTGGQTFTTATITINLDTVRKNSDGAVFSLASDELTVNTTDTFVLVYRVGLDVSSGVSRSTCQTFLEKDSGGGFSEVTGFKGWTYNRQALEGENSTTVQGVIDVNSGDKFRIRAVRNSGTDTIITLAKSSSLTLFTLGKGQAGATGATGAGSNVTLKDEGTNVTNTPHSALNFVGSNVAVTDNGDGSANVTISGGVEIDIQSATSTTQTTTTSTSYVDVNSMTLTTTNSSSKEYLVYFNATVQHEDNKKITIILNVDGTDDNTSMREINFSNANKPLNIGTVLKTASLITGKIIKMKWKTDSSTAKMDGRSLIIQGIS